MKTHLLLLFCTSILFFSCSNEENPKSYDMEISFEEANYTIKEQDDLNNYVRDVLGSKDAVITESSFETLTDEAGEQFNAVVAYFNLGEKTNQRLIISLDGNNAKNAAISFSTGCLMRCNPGDNCTSCGMAVHEKCKRITCSCSKGSMPGTGCGTEIAFY